jgi:hypothetical protein
MTKSKDALVHKCGSDTVMDLSTGKNIHATREWIIRNSPVPSALCRSIRLWKSWWESRRADPVNLPRHFDRTGRTRRRLFHDSRWRAPALHPDDCQANHGHRESRRVDHGYGVSHITKKVFSTRASVTSAKSCRHDVSFSGEGCVRAQLLMRTTKRNLPNWKRSAS